MSLVDHADDVDAAQAAAAQRRARTRAAPASARRTAASGRPTTGGAIATRCATSRWGWRRSASSAATSCRWSATTARSSTSPSSRRRRWAASSVPVYQDSIASRAGLCAGPCRDVGRSSPRTRSRSTRSLSLKDRLPKLRWIVYDDPRGLWAYDDPMLRSFESVLEEGRAFGEANPDFYATELAKGGADDIAMIAYTSGTTGSPKGVMLSHRNMIARGRGLHRGRTTSSPGDNWLSYLPMAWVGDAAFSLGMALAGELTANCPESPETRAARPARARARRDAGAAAHLGEHADHDAGQGRRCLAG